MTNFEKIKQKTFEKYADIEEYADTMALFLECDECSARKGLCFMNCKARLIKWLNEEAENTDDEF